MKKGKIIGQLEEALGHLESLEESAKKLEAFVDILRRWNSRISLTGLSRDSNLLAHIKDCIYAWKHIDRKELVIDVGSGIGLPGIVFASLSPNASFVLVEPSYKRSVFLEEAVKIMGLENTTVTRRPIEEYNPKERRYLLVAKAFSPILRLPLLVSHLVSPKNPLYIMTTTSCKLLKGDALKKSGFRVSDKAQYNPEFHTSIILKIIPI